MKKTLLSLLFLVFSIISAFSQRAILRGVITDVVTNEPLVGASVVVKGTTRGAITDIDGIYQLELTKDNYDIIISYVGYATLEKVVQLQSDLTLDVPMSSSMALEDITSLHS